MKSLGTECVKEAVSGLSSVTLISRSWEMNEQGD